MFDIVTIPLSLIENFFISSRKYLLLRQKDSVPTTNPKLKMSVRKADLADIERIVEIRIKPRIFSEFRQRRKVEQLKERMRIGHFCFVAESEGKICGVLWVGFHNLYVAEIGKVITFRDNEAMFYDAFTVPSYRGKGIISKAYEFSTKHLLTNNKNTFYVIVSRENKASLKSVKKVNFCAFGIITSLNFFGYRKSFLDKYQNCE